MPVSTSSTKRDVNSLMARLDWLLKVHLQSLLGSFMSRFGNTIVDRPNPGWRRGDVWDHICVPLHSFPPQYH